MKARHKDTGEIIELAEEGIISHDGRRFCWYQVELLPEPNDECKPSLPSNLDEAAEEAAKTWRKNPDGSESREIFFLPFIRGFKAGAKWLAGQGETYELTVESPVLGPPMICCPVKGADNGDKVIVNIRKK